MKRRFLLFLEPSLVVASICWFALPQAQADLPPRFISLSETFEREIKREIEPLERKYLTALEGIQRDYAKSGNLEGAVVIKNEIEHVKGKQPSEEEDDEPAKTTEELTRLQGSYHQAIERAAKPTIDRYREALVRLQEVLTTENQVESAVKVRDRLAEIDQMTPVELVTATTSGGAFVETASLKDWLQTREFHWRGDRADVLIHFDGRNAHVVANGTEIMERKIDFEDDQTFSFQWSSDDLNTFTISDNRRSFTRHMSKTDSVMQGEIRDR